MGRVSQKGLSGVSQALSIRVDDPDTHCRHAKTASAAIIRDLTDEEYGSRGYMARTPKGTFNIFVPIDPVLPWGDGSRRDGRPNNRLKLVALGSPVASAWSSRAAA